MRAGGMRGKSVLGNYLYYLFRLLGVNCFSLVSFAYSSRVLGVEGLGRINFSRSVISVFVMIAMLGIHPYGIREAAKARDDREKLSKLTREILCINLVSMLFAFLLLVLSICFSSVLRDYRPLLWINSISILLSVLGMEWLFCALEEYALISVWAILFRIAGILMMLLFVRDQTDVAVYALINVMATSGSLIVNFIYARKYICFRKGETLGLRKHLPSILWLFVMAVTIDLYTVLDTVMLGWLSEDRAVGCYSAAIKMIRIVNAVITTLGAVLAPRLSYYIGNREEEKILTLVRKGYNFGFLISIPSAIGLFVLSDEWIRLFAGSGYGGVGFTMRILTPIVVLIPFSMMTNQQSLIPMGREKLVIISTGVGAVTNMICNRVLIPRYAENGAACGTLIAECVVALICFINVGRFFDIRAIFRRYYQYWVAALPIFAIAFGVKWLFAGYPLRIAVTVLVAVIWYAGVLWMFRNEYYEEALARLRGFLKV